MTNWNNFTEKYIEQLNDNTFYVESNPNLRLSLLDEIIKEKRRRVKSNYQLTEDDFALVRIMKSKDFPKDLVYRTLSERAVTATVDNPFKLVISYTKYNIDYFADLDLGEKHELINPDDLKINYHPYRDTKHFSINGLCSDIKTMTTSYIYTNGDVVVIEPLKNRLKDKRLVNLNPVDTFFDLKNKPMAISDNAIFIIRESAYIPLMNDEKIKDSLKERKKYIFNGDINVAVDIILCNLGYLPQHSRDQSYLETEFSKAGDDQTYLKLFQDYIEYLSTKYLNLSYYEIPQEYINRRKQYNDEILALPGILHPDTKYGDIETNENIKNILKSYYDYLTVIFDVLGYNKNELSNFYKNIEQDVCQNYNKPYEQRFPNAFSKHENLMVSVVKDLTYPKLKTMTKKHNEKFILNNNNKKD